MPTSQINALPSPDINSPNRPDLHFDALIAQLDSRLNPRFPTVAARDAAITSPVNGMRCWCDNPGWFYRRRGGVWVPEPIETDGLLSDSTDGSGLNTIIHNLGVTPSSFQLTRGPFPAANVADGRVTALSTTQAQVVTTRTDGTALASNPVVYYWNAKRTAP